ncbi:SDR family oxidoreductase TDEL_0D00270 [Torulaspora delbrueckii]|uniref:NAD-dependent epimerase/dehydratase domain-containing protein n=1 Tax=Torulaspora delbrueckii TaxID=4950 RepID=G8ZSL7_TORDE|nr:hypothetical protein TDEL_0D00270 [Torulaspora delbrueckii]CCE91611.1 hypothetical protein TDEL_0D00270 [Torulaspora delbrueckii]
MVVSEGCTVFVSGANGFIASHVVNELLSSGYKVIGSVRSQAKADQLLEHFSHPELTISIVSDISAAAAFDEIFSKYGQDIKVVLHTASPFHYDTEDCEKDLLQPAVEGTKSILQAIKKYAAHSVERVVITSSDAAVTSYESDIDPKNLHTEDSWNSITWEEACKDAEAAYYGSKTFAERAAWEFMHENEGKINFKLSTVNPVWVFGPQLSDSNATGRLNTSCQYINDLVHSTPKTKLDMSIAGGYVDVRDVARAHLAAFQKAAAIGQRLVLCAGRFTLVNIVDVLDKRFPKLKGKIASGDAEESKKLLSSLARYDYSKTNHILEFEFLPFEKTIYDTAAQVLKVEGRL